MLLTRAPLYREGYSEEQSLPFSLDLHVLGAPLTFVLSQDQTLQLNFGFWFGEEPSALERSSPESFALATPAIPCWARNCSAGNVERARFSIFRCLTRRLASPLDTVGSTSSSWEKIGVTTPRPAIPCWAIYGSACDQTSEEGCSQHVQSSFQGARRW